MRAWLALLVVTSACGLTDPPTLPARPRLEMTPTPIWTPPPELIHRCQSSCQMLSWHACVVEGD